MSKGLNVLTPDDSDLYPTPDERAEIEKIIGPWEVYETEVSAAEHRFMRRRALKAFRAGYALRSETVESAYRRGYDDAEEQAPCCCERH